jgi:hypothetical protein
VPVTGDDEEGLPVAVGRGADRASGRARVEEDAFRHRPLLERRRDDVPPVGERAGEQESRVVEGQVRREDDVLSIDAPAGRQERCAVDPLCGRPLEHVTAASRDALREREEELQGMELRLVLEAKRTRRRDGQRHIADDLGAEGETASRFGVRLEPAPFFPRVGPHICRQPAEVALDPLVTSPLLDEVDRRLVRFGVQPRLLRAEALHELVVLDAVLRCQLRRRVAGRAPAEPARLDQRDGPSCFLQQERGQDADDSAAGDRDVDADVALEARVLRLAGGREPKRARPVDGSVSRRPLLARARHGFGCTRHGEKHTVESRQRERAEATAEAAEARARLGRGWPLVAGAAGALGVVIALVVALLVWLL